MAINFPDSPATNDSFTSGGKKWIFNGTTWNLITANSYTISTGEVTAAKIASSAVTEAKINDGAVTTGKIAAGAVTAAKLGNDISLTPADGSITQAKLASTLSGITICTSSTKPASPFVGQMIFETDTNYVKVYTSGGWSVGMRQSTSFAVRYLVVAGGGGGGSDMGGGGGAGGYLAGTTTLTAGTTYTVTVGAGGTGALAGDAQPRGVSGVNSSAFSLTSIGGGGGASDYASSGVPYAAASGGSGGGAPGNSQPAGTGTVGQGNDGRAGAGSYYPGGGGGAGSPGGYRFSGSTLSNADGGYGIQNDITGTNYFWAGGGAGGGYSTWGGSGGRGGGGGGAPAGGGTGLGDTFGINAAANGTNGSLGTTTNVPGGNGGTNTGGGGGGGSHWNSNNYGGNGGSGIVVVRYLTADGVGKTITGGTTSTVGTDTVHTFTASGTLSIA